MGRGLIVTHLAAAAAVRRVKTRQQGEMALIPILLAALAAAAVVAFAVMARRLVLPVGQRVAQAATTIQTSLLRMEVLLAVARAARALMARAAVAVAGEQQVLPLVQAALVARVQKTP